MKPQSSSFPALTRNRILQIALWVAAFALFAKFQPKFLINTISFLAALGVLVFVHELGHFQLARWAGMKVYRFGIGFPPWVATFRRNGIDYSLGAFPVGGMVDIAGLGVEEEMVSTSPDDGLVASGPSGSDRDNEPEQLMRTADGGTVSTGGVARATYEYPSIDNLKREPVEGTAGDLTADSTEEPDGRRAIVDQDPGRITSLQNPYQLRRRHGERLFGECNLGWRFLTLFAGPGMNFLFATLIFIGVYSIAGFPQPHLRPLIQEVSPGKPASVAGLRAGDVILAVNGKKTPEQTDVQEIILHSKGPVALSVQRGTQTVPLAVVPKPSNFLGLGYPTPAIGVTFDDNALLKFTYIRMSPWEGVKTGFYTSVFMVEQIGHTLTNLVTFRLTTNEQKDIGGPVRMAQQFSQIRQSGWAVALNAVGMLSVNLGLMNLLPFPALDGGRILFLGYELIARRKLDPRKEGLVHALGMVMIIVLMAVITLRDVVGLFHHVKP